MRHNKVASIIGLLLSTLSPYAQSDTSWITFSSATSISYFRMTTGYDYDIPQTPTGAVNLAIDKSRWKLGQCSWASPDSIHICGCHQIVIGNSYSGIIASKIKIGLLSREMPKETNIVQKRWYITKNIIHVVYTNRDGTNEIQYQWQWNGQTFKLLNP